MNDITEIAWAAGLFDGEGTTFTTSDHHSLQLSLAQVNRQNLERFQRAVGGLGRIHRPIHHTDRQPISKFAAYGPDAWVVIQVLNPFLGQEKRDQALRALLSYSFRTVKSRQGFCQRGHEYAKVGAYLNPSRGRECVACRRHRRRGPLPPRPVVRAIEARIGIREYQPAQETK
jgi:hypothetical protein